MILFQKLLLNAGQNENPSGGGLGDALPMIIVWVVVIVLFGYFAMYRPEKKRKKQKQEMLDSMKKGSRVTTIGGIQGKIVRIKDDTLIIEVGSVGNEKMEIEIQRWAVGSVNNPDDDSSAD